MAHTATQLAMLKVDLGLMAPTTEQAAYLNQLLDAADLYLRRQGIPLVESSTDDELLIASTAAWMYRSRAAADAPRLPASLQARIHNRICHERLAVDV